MRRKAVVVVPPSQFDGSHPPPEDLSYFDLFGLKPTLLPNLEELRAKFYELSKQFHPDTSKKIYTTAWARLVNQAYQTLKDRERVALYVLGGELKGNKIPTELAELYFDLQDAEGKEALKDFKEVVARQLQESEVTWEGINQLWIENGDKSLIEKQLTLERYLKSMLADIEKKL